MIEKKQKGILARNLKNDLGTDWINWFPDIERKDVRIDGSYWRLVSQNVGIRCPSAGIEEFRLRYPDYKGKIPRKGRWMETEI